MSEQKRSRRGIVLATAPLRCTHITDLDYRLMRLIPRYRRSRKACVASRCLFRFRILLENPAVAFQQPFEVHVVFVNSPIHRCLNLAPAGFRRPEYRATRQCPDAPAHRLFEIAPFFLPFVTHRLGFSRRMGGKKSNIAVDHLLRTLPRHTGSFKLADSKTCFLPCHAIAARRRKEKLCDNGRPP